MVHSILTSNIRDGGPGKDGIIALLQPKFIDAQSAEYISDDQLIIGVKVGDEMRAYPHLILDWHEIVNDLAGDVPFSVTYCPLTGSALVWNRRLNGRENTFGVSGLLYNSNLIAYDRGTDSYWSQFQSTCVNGELIGQNSESMQAVETTWLTWKSMYPNSKVLSLSTGHTRNYGIYPYGDYKSNHQRLLFPVNIVDNRLPRKSRVLGVTIGNSAVAFPLENFSDFREVINYEIEGVPIVVIGSEPNNYAVAYQRTLASNTVVEFTSDFRKPSGIMKDELGTVYDIFGEAIDGARFGRQLHGVNAFISYWFAWSAFHPETEIYSK